MVKRVGKELLDHERINKLADNLNLRGIGGEFVILRQNDDLFNAPEESKLLADFEKAVKAAGGMKEKAWKYTIVRM